MFSIMTLVNKQLYKTTSFLDPFHRLAGEPHVFGLRFATGFDHGRFQLALQPCHAAHLKAGASVAWFGRVGGWEVTLDII